MLLETVAASILRSKLTGRGEIRAGEGTIGAGENLFWDAKILWKWT